MKKTAQSVVLKNIIRTIKSWSVIWAKHVAWVVRKIQTENYSGDPASRGFVYQWADAYGSEIFERTVYNTVIRGPTDGVRLLHQRSTCQPLRTIVHTVHGKNSLPVRSCMSEIHSSRAVFPNPFSMQEPLQQTFIPRRTPTDVTKTKHRAADNAQTSLQYCQLAGQKFPRYLEGNL
jgi:hypothetical protein